MPPATPTPPPALRLLERRARRTPPRPLTTPQAAPASWLRWLFHKPR